MLRNPYTPRAAWAHEVPLRFRTSPDGTNDHHLTITRHSLTQARAAIADYRAVHNLSEPMWSAERYLRHWKELAPFHTIDRIVFWRKTSA